MKEGMRYQFMEEVRVRPMTWFDRYITNIFDGRKRSRKINQVGRVVSGIIAEYSKEPLYTILFEDKESLCLFENELEPAATDA